MIPNRTKTRLLDGAFDLTNDTLRVALLQESTEYDPDPENHAFVADILDGGTTAEEFSDTNYSRQTLTGKSTTYSDAYGENYGNETKGETAGVLTADNLRWGNLGGSQRVEAILIYKQVGVDDSTPGDDPVIRVIDDSETTDLSIASDGADFTILWRRGVLGVA